MTPHWWFRGRPTLKFSSELRNGWILLPNAGFEATALNLGKSFATGRDFGREQKLHVRLTFRGDVVPFVPSGQSFRCLGVQFNRRLNGIEGKQLVLQK